MKSIRVTILVLALITGSIALKAQNQQPMTPEQQEKKLLEAIDKEVQRLSSLLELEYWQEFYVDSTLTHDLAAMQEELEDLSGTDALPAEDPDPEPVEIELMGDVAYFPDEAVNG